MACFANIACTNLPFDAVSFRSLLQKACKIRADKWRIEMSIVRSVTLPDGEKMYWIDSSLAERLAEERKAAERRAAMMADAYQRMFEAFNRRRIWWPFWNL